MYGPDESIPPAFATSANFPAPFPVDPGKEPNDLFKSFPNLSVKESPIIPSESTNTSNAPESNDP